MASEVTVRTHQIHMLGWYLALTEDEERVLPEAKEDEAKLVALPPLLPRPRLLLRRLPPFAGLPLPSPPLSLSPLLSVSLMSSSRCDGGFGI